jgi:hypothetical protein
LTLSAAYPSFGFKTVGQSIVTVVGYNFLPQDPRNIIVRGGGGV